jgi:predicted metal-dependent HD superfamily phosphohydrolase
MTVNPTLLQETEAFIRQYFNEKMPDKYVFHDLEHTLQTVAAVKVLGEGCELTAHDLLILQLSMFFHDTGYKEGPPEHEERSCVIARNFLDGMLPEEDLKTISDCILATKVPQNPHSLLQKICCDADLGHLGMEIYWDRTGKLRQEFILSRKNVMSEQEWINFELNFMLRHEYHTEVAREMFNKRKAKHIQQLIDSQS